MWFFWLMIIRGGEQGRLTATIVCSKPNTLIPKVFFFSFLLNQFPKFFFFQCIKLKARYIFKLKKMVFQLQGLQVLKLEVVFFFLSFFYYLFILIVIIIIIMLEVAFKASHLNIKKKRKKEASHLGLIKMNEAHLL